MSDCNINDLMSDAAPFTGMSSDQILAAQAELLCRIYTNGVVPVGVYLEVANNLSDVASPATSRTNLGLGTAAVQNVAFFLQSANNLSDVANAATSRTNLGLGSAAQQTIAFFLQSANNLSDLANAGTARTNLGLGTAAVQNVAFFAQVANNLSDLANATTARTNLGLGTANSPTFTGLTLSGLTATRVVFAGTAGVLEDDADFVWNKTTNTLTLTSGVVLAGVGAPATVSYGFNGYANVGMYSRTASVISFNQGGSQPRVEFNSTGIEIGSDNSFQWSSASANATASSDLFLWRDGAAGVLAQRNSTNAQTFRVYKTYTDASNYERAKFAWVSDTLEIGTESAGTGIGRAIQFKVSSGGRWNMDTVAFFPETDNQVDLGTTSKGIRATYLAGKITIGGTAAANQITKVLQGSAAIDFASVTAGTESAIQTITVTGAAAGDPVYLGLPDAASTPNIRWTVWVSASNTVSLKFYNSNTVTAVDLASLTYKVTVIQQ